MNQNDFSTDIQPTLFSLHDSIPSFSTSNTCNTCEHRQRWEYGSKVFQYCGIRRSARTDNKLLKIKCKDIACSLYKPIA